MKQYMVFNHYKSLGKQKKVISVVEEEKTRKKIKKRNNFKIFEFILII